MNDCCCWKDCRSRSGAALCKGGRGDGADDDNGSEGGAMDLPRTKDSLLIIHYLWLIMNIISY